MVHNKGKDNKNKSTARRVKNDRLAAAKSQAAAPAK